MTNFDITDQNRVRRVPKRGAYDKESVYRVVDAALICHVGIVGDPYPIVIPTLHARMEDEILLHGSSASRLIRYAASGAPLCLTMTHVDGIVLARSVFNHSINYRSAVLFGHGRIVDDSEQKLEAMRLFTEKIIPGRWDDARLPNEVEMKATSIISVNIESASAKVRTGPPGDDPEDMDLPMWAGVLPIHQQIAQPQHDPNRLNEPDVPDYVWRFIEENNG